VTCGGSGQVRGTGGAGNVPDNQAAEAEAARQAAETARQAAAAAQQRALEEQQRKEREEAARRQVEFDRAKQDALRTMKGITDNELGLKGATTGTDLGLKGLGDAKTGDLGLKGIGDPAPPPFIDASVVDLRDKKQPLVVDPNVVKGTPPPTTQPQFLAGLRSPDRDRDILLYLYPPDQRNGVFPKNPEQRLINPLREPERYQAWEASVQAQLVAHARKNQAQEVIALMDQDATLNAARNRIVKEEEAAIYAAHTRLAKELGQKFEAFRKANGLKDFLQMLQKEKDDPAFKQQSQALVDAYWKDFDTAAFDARQNSLRQMQVEIARFTQRHADGEKGKKP